jgi:hypothetical protein
MRHRRLAAIERQLVHPPNLQFVNPHRPMGNIRRHSGPVVLQEMTCDMIEITALAGRHYIERFPIIHFRQALSLIMTHDLPNSSFRDLALEQGYETISNK